MIDLNLSISNPWSNRWDTLFAKSNLFLKNKAWEFNGYRTNQIFDFEFRLTFRGDHAGLKFGIGILGYNLELCVYDTRHWNYIENRFYEPNESVWPDQG
jgi:hypothetical protein